VRPSYGGHHNGYGGGHNSYGGLFKKLFKLGIIGVTNIQKAFRTSA
jgi:hypothetical protein